jgi:hypothetical protein
MVKAKKIIKDEYIKNKKFKALCGEVGVSYQYMLNVVHDSERLPSSKTIDKFSDHIEPNYWFVVEEGICS